MDFFWYGSDGGSYGHSVYPSLGGVYMYFSEHMEIGMYLIMSLITRTYVRRLRYPFVQGHVDCDTIRDSFHPSLWICIGISDRRVVASVTLQASN